MTITVELNPNESIESAPHHYFGLAADTKPTVASHDSLPEPTSGSTFLEYDSGVRYITRDGTNWKFKASDFQRIVSIEHPFGKGDLTSDGVQWSDEVSTADANWTTVESVTVEPPADGSVIEIEFGITYRTKSSSTAKHVKHKAQARDKDGTWVDLYGEVTRAANASVYAEVTYSGRFETVANADAVPVDIQVMIKREDSAENATAQVKNSSYVKITYETS